jgi:predicted Zn-dependent protease
MPIRDAETETLPHSFARLDARLVRITLVRKRAINAFAGTGNRMFPNTGRPG